MNPYSGLQCPPLSASAGGAQTIACWKPGVLHLRPGLGEFTEEASTPSAFTTSCPNRSQAWQTATLCCSGHWPMSLDSPEGTSGSSQRQENGPPMTASIASLGLALTKGPAITRSELR